MPPGKYVRKPKRKTYKRKAVKRRTVKRKKSRKAPVRQPKPEVFTLKRDYATRTLGYQVSEDAAGKATHFAYGEVRDGTNNSLRPPNTRYSGGGVVVTDPTGSGICVQAIPPPVTGCGSQGVRGHQFYQTSLHVRMVVDYTQVERIGQDFPYRVIAGYWKPSKFLPVLTSLRAVSGEPFQLTTTQAQINWWFQCGQYIIDTDRIHHPPLIDGPDFRKTEITKNRLRFDDTVDPLLRPSDIEVNLKRTSEDCPDVGYTRLRNSVSRFKAYMDVKYDKVTCKKGNMVRQTTPRGITSNMTRTSNIVNQDGVVVTANTDTDFVNRRTPDVHNISFGAGYKKVVCTDNMGPFIWNRWDVGVYDTADDEVSQIGAERMQKENVAITALPNNWGMDEPVPFVATVFLNQEFLDQRNHSEQSVAQHNQIAPTGVNPNHAPGTFNLPWVFTDLTAATANDSGNVVLQPLVSMTTTMRYQDN